MVARLALLGALPLASAAGEGAADGQGRWQFSHTDPSLTYNYLAIGDWGDDSGGQAAAAAGMGAVAEEIHAQEVMHSSLTCTRLLLVSWSIQDLEGSA